MKKQEIMELAERRGLCVYEQYDENDRRKIYYKVRIPVFTDGKVIPTGYEDKLVANIKEVKQMADGMWKEEWYRSRTSEWLSKY